MVRLFATLNVALFQKHALIPLNRWFASCGWPSTIVNTVAASWRDRQRRPPAKLDSMSTKTHSYYDTGQQTLTHV